MEIPEIERVSAYTPRAGDVLIFEFTRPVRPETAAEVKRQLRQQFPPSVKIVLLDGLKVIPVIHEDEPKLSPSELKALDPPDMPPAYGWPWDRHPGWGRWRNRRHG